MRKNADERLHDALLELALKYQRGDEDNVLIPRPPTQSELAAFIFSSRESVGARNGADAQNGIVGAPKTRAGNYQRR